MLRFVAILACLAAATQGAIRPQNLPAAFRNNPDLPAFTGKIVGGTEAVENSIPYQVSWQINPKSVFCGGSVLDANTVLTAAHCCDAVGFNNGEVVAGEHSIREDSGLEQRIKVSEVRKNSAYDDATLDNDVCILKLATPLELNDQVQPMTLPAAGDLFESGTARVSGWGTTSSGGSISDVLRYVDVPIVDDKVCNSNYGLFGGIIVEDMICAGQEGLDSCQGDSGGPLMCENQTVQCGIVSWGVGCAFDGFPGVYTEVSAYIDWISENSV